VPVLLLPLRLFFACGPSLVGPEPSAWERVVVATLGDAQVLDARSPEDWAAGHVPGAAHLHWTEVETFDADGLWGVPPVAEVAALLGERGVDAERPVVIYGGGVDGWGDDGNLYWTLRYAGHTDVRVLDGGWLGWVAAGGVPETVDDAPAPTEFTAEPDLTALADTEDVATWSGLVLDVRSQEEWDDGHIPGAVWFPWDSVFDADGTLLDPDVVSDQLAAVGAIPDVSVVTYCQAGVRAGHTFMVLEALGAVDAANYVGSWARWFAEGGAVEVDSRR
jgi:thiosulfate/3-mercaptopyruvate sulfurtransferase